MNDVSQALQQALKRHQSGDFEEAGRQYRAILAQDENQADAWHLLGLVDYAHGNYEQAIAHIGRAISLHPAPATFHNHLGEALLAAGRVAEAEESCRRALELQPTYAIAHNTLGTVLNARGAVCEAIASFQRAVALAPQFAQAHCNLASAYAAREQFANAEASYRQAIAAQSGYVLALYSLAVLLQQQERLDEAAALYERVLALSPDHAQAHCNLASVLKDQNRLPEALAGYDRALALDTRLPEALFNRAVIHQQQKDYPAAEAGYRAAIEARPNYPAALSNLGTVCKQQGRLDEALDCYDRALAIDATLAEPHRNRALLLLLFGNYADGWREYEWRLRVPGAPRTSFSQLPWSGQSIPGQTLLVIAEQGLGDAVQFVRYAALIKRQSQARVLLHCSARLHALLASAAGIDQLLAGPVTQSFDCYLHLLSAPAVFGTTLDTVPAEVPYLAVDKDRIEHWRRELINFEGYKIAIAWQGNPQYEDDARRSVPLAAFAPLAEIPGVRLFSLQKQHGLEQLAAQKERLSIVDLGPRLDEEGQAFVDTASVLENMDLVVTSDSAVAHLAGALGVPVWMAVAQVPDWRWLLERDDSPWYPTMRLFRQTSPGDWTAVFSRIATALREVIKRHG
jgi:tetratricopeptide (TPR) repeat protein